MLLNLGGNRMNIQHNPILNVEKAAQLYSEKDGVDVRYVCTSATSAHAAQAADIFYRATPHPEFGNRYFGLYFNLNGNLMITGCDAVEDLDFDMVEVEGVLHYSQHRHDYRCVGCVCIDGGRSYLKRSGDLSLPVVRLKLKDGEFVNAED
jgi:hypothetical protein